MARQEQILYLLKIIMVSTGCWRLKLTKNTLINTFYNIYSVIFQTSLLLFLLGLLLNAPKVFRQKDFEKISENIGYSIIVFVMGVKMLICQTDNVQNLLEQCLMDQSTMYREEPGEVHEVFKGGVKVLNKIIKMLTIAMICTTGSLCIATHSDYMDYMNSNSTGDKPLILPLWYPFDTDKYYKTAFYVGLYLSIVGTACNLATQVLFLTLMTHAAIQMKSIQILGRGLTKFSKLKNAENLSEEVVVKSTLRDLCLKHQSIISFVDDFNLAMSNILLIEFLLNSVNIAAIMIRISIMEISFWMKICLTILCNLQVVQLFLMAWHANELQVQSVLLSDALFESNWYEQSESAKRTVAIMMMRSRKPLRLFVGPFFPMAINTAITTMKGAYSYVTLMVSMTNDD